MRRDLVLLVILLVLGFSQLNFTTPSKNVQQFRAYLVTELSLLETSLHKLQSDTANRNRTYHEARQHYKHVEFFIEYYSPREAKLLINGPLVPKHDVENGATVVYPKGFQVIEELLFSGDSLSETDLSQTILALRKQLARLKGHYQGTAVTEPMLLEMAQLQFHRLASLTLNGYDATYTLTNATEAMWSLAGVQQVLLAFKETLCQQNSGKKTWQKANADLQRCIEYLKKRPDYNTINRLEFITQYLIPINESWVRLHDASGVEWQKKRQAIDLRKANPFVENAFNLRYFSIYYNDTANLGRQAELGKLLFFDPVLSGNGLRSCASCHKPGSAFAEPVATSLHFDEESRLKRNAPTLVNVLFQQAFFHDGRTGQLEQQAFDVAHNRDEMSGNLKDAANKLEESDDYKQLFSQAFANEKTPKITVYQIQKALAEYERSLVALNSRFDKYIGGDKKALSPREINGYNIFAGKALCGSCHFFPLFNGTVPPAYSDSEFEVIGTPQKKDNKQLSLDSGRVKFTRLPIHQWSFKTPTVRNVEVTAPYMHNGVFETLEEVVEFYHKGGGKGLGLMVTNQTLPFDSLQLSISEKEELVLFMKTLTDYKKHNSMPTQLPTFRNSAVLNQRKVGGNY